MKENLIYDAYCFSLTSKEIFEGVKKWLKRDGILGGFLETDFEFLNGRCYEICLLCPEANTELHEEWIRDEFIQRNWHDSDSYDMAEERLEVLSEIKDEILRTLTELEYINFEMEHFHKDLINLSKYGINRE